MSETAEVAQTETAGESDTSQNQSTGVESAENQKEQS